MAEAPERVWMDPDIKFPECEKQYGCDVEYIRKDVSDARIAEAREGALREALDAAGEYRYRRGEAVENAILALIEKDAE